MADEKPEEQVLFRVTRPNTTIFHPDRSVSFQPIQTGGEVTLPKSVADYHVRHGVGEIVTEEAPAEAKTPAPAAKKAAPSRPLTK